MHSFGAMSVTFVFSSALPASAKPGQIIAEFLAIAEGYSLASTRTRKGILLLQAVPGQRESGSIYIYDRVRVIWYRLSFASLDDTFTLEKFQQVYREYDLLSYTVQPGLLLKMVDSSSEQQRPELEDPASLAAVSVSAAI